MFTSVLMNHTTTKDTLFKKYFANTICLPTFVNHLVKLHG